MHRIGEWATLFEKMTIENYLGRHPPALLLQPRNAGSFTISQDDPGMTLFRVEPDVTALPTIARDPSDRSSAFMVLALGASGLSPTPVRYSLGCGESCDLQMTDASVSREHAWIERHGDRYAIEDTGSTLGTRVEGKRLVPGEKRALKSGDALIIGEVEATFLEPRQFFEFVRAYCRAD